MDQIVRTKLREISEQWNEVERYAKEAEHFRNELIISAINEMRYAGRRIVDGLIHVYEPGDKAQNDKFITEINIAKSYIINADLDITDSICGFVHIRVRNLLDWYGFDAICDACPGFRDFYPRILEAQAIIQVSREDRSNRLEKYNEIKANYIPDLKDLYERLIATPELSPKDNWSDQIVALDKHVEDVDQHVSDLSNSVGLLDKHIGTVQWIALVGSIASILSIFLSLFFEFS